MLKLIASGLQQPQQQLKLLTNLLPHCACTRNWLAAKSARVTRSKSSVWRISRRNYSAARARKINHRIWKYKYMYERRRGAFFWVGAVLCRREVLCWLLRLAVLFVANKMRQKERGRRVLLCIERSMFGWLERLAEGIKIKRRLRFSEALEFYEPCQNSQYRDDGNF